MKRMKESELVKDYVDQLQLVKNSLIKKIVEKILVKLFERYEAIIPSLENSKYLSSITLVELLTAL
ncbi:gag-pol polyprotein [Gossypium australe]|uniref:Gag-pol polyprotein n=1 Tax=Gossypium australe TaxID=47621 RepID=A0A5B6WS56_9ROSI|nr:gag-pol polyprotein [Gossypium australe]